MVKFYLEMSDSPSQCVLAVIVLSISTASACFPHHLLSPGRGRGVRRWCTVKGKERMPSVLLLARFCLSTASSWWLTPCPFVLLCSFVTLLFTFFKYVALFYFSFTVLFVTFASLTPLCTVFSVMSLNFILSSSSSLLNQQFFLIRPSVFALLGSAEKILKNKTDIYHHITLQSWQTWVTL